MEPRANWEPRPLPGGTAARTDLVDLLARAFLDDPVASHIDPDPRRRWPAVRAAFRLLVEETAASLVIDVVGDPIVGAAVWIPPGTSSSVEGDGAPADDVWTRLELPFPGQIERFREAVSALDGAHASAFDDSYWYLRFLATDAGLEHKGIASALLAHHAGRLAGSDDPLAACALDAFGDRLRAFYERRGWEVVATHDLPFTDQTLYAMRRGSRP